MKKLLDKAEGYKTYFMCALMLLSVGAFMFDIISMEELEALVVLFGAGGLVGLRHAIAKD